MKIAQLSTCHENTPPVKYGSINRIVSTLTEELVRRGHDVTLFATAKSTTRARLKWVFEEPREGFYHIDDDWVHVIKSLTNGERFDIVHNHNIYGGVSLCSLANCRGYLTTCHTKPNLTFLRHFLPHNFVALSHSHFARMSELAPLATIYPAIDLVDYPFDYEKGEYLLYLGQISHEKGTKEAIQVANELGVPLQIAGVVAPWNKSYFDVEIEPLLNDRIRFVGEVGGTEKLDLLRGAKCLIFPSNTEETFGLAMIEAMVCGTPVVGTSKGAIPEVVLDGETGFVADGVEALVEAAQKIGDIDPYRCRAHVRETFSVERMASNYLALYDTLLARQL